MKKKAIAYISDVILGEIGEVINRKAQKELIRQYAKENGIEVIAWFEDEVYSEDLLSRPGIRKLLESETECECLLVERIWALTRNWNELLGFMNAIESKGLKLESATMLWDCVSQKARQYYRRGSPIPRVVRERVVEERVKPVRVRAPLRVNFAALKRATRTG